MTSRFRRRSEHAFGADELFLILLLVFLATSVGIVRDRTFLLTGLHVTSQALANAPESRLGVLHIVYDDAVRVQFGDRPEAIVPGTPCAPMFADAIEKVIRTELGPPRGPVEIVVSPRKETQICVYLDTQTALKDLATEGLVEDRLRFELQLDEKEK